MGADLIIEWIEIKDGMDLNRIRKDMLNTVNSLTEIDNDIKDFYTETTGEFEQEYNITEVKKDFTEIINNVFDGLQDGYRDITTISHKGDNLYITGGMSWGDSPTDSYNLFYRFNYLPKKILDCCYNNKEV